MIFQRFWQNHRKAFAIALLVLYAPHLFTAYEMTDGNLLWILIAPGIFIATFVHDFLWNTFSPEDYRIVSRLFATLVAAVLIVLLTLIGARGRIGLIVAIVTGGIYSIVAAVMMYGWYSLGSV